jgi:predicted permease
MGLWQDIRFAARLLVKDKWVTLAAATALSLGIAANSAVFTLVNAVLIRGLPFDAPEQIVALSSRTTDGRFRGISIPDFEDWKASSRLFDAAALSFTANLNVSDDSGQPADRYSGPYISTDIFRIIRQHPILGRNFTPDDDRLGADPVVMLGYGIWTTRYGSDPSIVGKTIKINSLPLTVIGVMPRDMRFPPNSDLWIPFSQLSPGLRVLRRDARNFNGIARLKPGVTIEQARAELSAIGRALTAQYPDTNKDVAGWVRSFDEAVNGDPLRVVFGALMGAVAFVLLIACANVANLLLARAAARSREISVRVSLGATRWRIVRQLLIESVLLAVLSGAIGLLLSIGGIRLFDAATAATGQPYYMVFTLDGVVFAYLAAVCLGTAVVFGLAPALHVSRTNVNDLLKEGGRSGGAGMRARRWTAVLMVAELALTLVLLGGAGLMMRSFLNLYRADFGIETANLTTMQLVLPDRSFPTPQLRAAFIQRVQERVDQMAEIEVGTISTNAPLGGGNARPLAVQGRDLPTAEAAPRVTTVGISAKYFETLGLRPARGRALNERDGQPGQDNVVINQQLASMHFAGEDPIGRQIQFMAEGSSAGDPAPWLTIVGIAPNVRQRQAQERDPEPVAYVPYVLQPSQVPTLIVRSRAPLAAATDRLRNEMRTLDPDMPLFNVLTMDERLAQQRWPFRVFGAMFAIFAAIALALSAVGLYAVTAYSVSQRTQEIGVRMALGAQPGQVLWLILRRALVQLSIGLAIGVGGAIGVGWLLRSLLVQMSWLDPITLTAIVAVLVAVALAATFSPARRATRLDPVAALRYE